MPGLRFGHAGAKVHRVTSTAHRPQLDSPSVTHIERMPARPGTSVDWPSWADSAVVGAFRARGIAAPWAHQVTAASLAFDGTHVVLATGTGSGKSLGYQLPVLSRLLADPRATALYLAPAKALAADQLRAVVAFGPPDVRPAPYSRATARGERRWLRQHSPVALTQPA